MRRDELTGARFGRLAVESLSGIVVTPGGTRRTAWLCRCECGKAAIVRGLDLKQGKVVSCGCYRDENTARRRRIHGHTTDGRLSREYQSWAHAKRRCASANDAQYRNYGARGITMCDRWRDSFEAFYSDMGNCPAGLELDRIDNDGNYEPGNCRWATRQQQNSNQRRNRLVTLRGEAMTVAEASRRVGIESYLVYGRLNNGWSVERALGIQ